MRKRAFLQEAAKAVKVRKLMHTPGMDEFAIRLNAEPTYQEQEHTNFAWSVFEKLGATLPDELPEGVNAFNMQQDLLKR